MRHASVSFGKLILRIYSTYTLVPQELVEAYLKQEVSGEASQQTRLLFKGILQPWPGSSDALSDMVRAAPHASSQESASSLLPHQHVTSCLTSKVCVYLQACKAWTDPAGGCCAEEHAVSCSELAALHHL